MRCLSVSATLALICLAGCGRPPGKPASGSEAVAPDQVMEFAVLYATNCAGCHGANGRGGAAIALANPVYLAIADEASVRKAVTSGVPGTAMPAFAQRAGGMLTEAQVAVITTGIRSWARPGILDGANPPSYAAKTAGDPVRGQRVFGTYCASCHGAAGEGGPKGSAITNDAFLALVSDQGLRTVIIAGRPDLGGPDWREYVHGRPMTDQEVTDVVAWLASRRVRSPGQPYAASSDGPRHSASNDAPR
jgi:mono/diheme cytochrome c family protein